MSQVDPYPAQLRELLVELAPCDIDGTRMSPWTAGLMHLVRTPPPGAAAILEKVIFPEATFLQLLDLYLVDEDIADWPMTDKALVHQEITRVEMRRLLLETVTLQGPVKTNG